MAPLAKTGRAALVIVALAIMCTAAQAQHSRGELRIEVRDSQGAALAAATAELVSDANQFQKNLVVVNGQQTIEDLPFGTYRLTLRSRGFAPWTKLIQIRSEVPVRLVARLDPASVATQIEVNDSATLVDPLQTATDYSLGREAITQQVASQPGRELSDLVNNLPGWLYEANGVLHPRGSEYDVQYVLDGVPVTQNRSPAFAPSANDEQIGSLRVLTAGYPAEYGRKLGGIVEVLSERNVPAGLHASFELGGGSYGMAQGSGTISYSRKNDRISFGGDGFRTDRYLDPPVLENFTNFGEGGGASASYEHDFSDHDRLRLSFSRDSASLQVPNELIQQEAGQRQNISNTETAGQVHFQHVISPDLLLSLSGSVRDSAAALSSNAQSTPVVVSQDRGYREGYFRADLAGHAGKHDWKIGLDGMFDPVHEVLHYQITDPAQFDPGTQQVFHFSDQRWDLEQSAYAEDQIHLGKWNLSGGLRFDHYRFVVHASGLSPRVAISRNISSLDLLVHGSYDRVFQTPAIENLLLASSPQLDSLDPLVVRLPVRPAFGNFYEIGLTKALFGKLRVDANVFRRDFRNFSDDDVLLDTGVSFPIAFAHAHVYGEELRLDLPRWGRVSGYASYTNQTGSGEGPVNGGLFLGSDVAGLSDRTRFAISQDQRNTFRGQVRIQASSQVWFAMAGEYGSGLPAEIDAANIPFLLSQYGPAMLSRVDLERGRVRPNFSLDASSAVDLYRREQRAAALQIEVANLTNHLNVINFASLFSGTAVAAPRTISARLRLTF